MEGEITKYKKTIADYERAIKNLQEHINKIEFAISEDDATAQEKKELHEKQLKKERELTEAAERKLEEVNVLAKAEEERANKANELTKAQKQKTEKLKTYIEGICSSLLTLFTKYEKPEAMRVCAKIMDTNGVIYEDDIKKLIAAIESLESHDPAEKKSLLQEVQSLKTANSLLQEDIDVKEAALARQNEIMQETLDEINILKEYNRTVIDTAEADYKAVVQSKEDLLSEYTTLNEDYIVLTTDYESVGTKNMSLRTQLKKMTDERNTLKAELDEAVSFFVNALKQRNEVKQQSENTGAQESSPPSYEVAKKMKALQAQIKNLTDELSRIKEDEALAQATNTVVRIADKQTELPVEQIHEELVKSFAQPESDAVKRTCLSVLKDIGNSIMNSSMNLSFSAYMCMFMIMGIVAAFGIQVSRASGIPQPIMQLEPGSEYNLNFKPGGYTDPSTNKDLQFPTTSRLRGRDDTTHPKETRAQMQASTLAQICTGHLRKRQVM